MPSSSSSNPLFSNFRFTKCLTDPTCTIFLKSMGFKGIKYDILVTERSESGSSGRHFFLFECCRISGMWASSNALHSHWWQQLWVTGGEVNDCRRGSPQDIEQPPHTPLHHHPYPPNLPRMTRTNWGFGCALTAYFRGLLIYGPVNLTQFTMEYFSGTTKYCKEGYWDAGKDGGHFFLTPIGIGSDRMIVTRLRDVIPKTGRW